MTGRQFSTRHTFQSGALATGNGVALNCAGLSQVGIQAVLAGTATVTPEASLDGVNWFGVNVTPASLAASVATITSSGLFTCAVAGFSLLRARISAWSSGAVDVVGVGTAASDLD